MPARELGGSFDPPFGARTVGTTLMKRHKTLPHPREEWVVEQIDPPPSITELLKLAGDTGFSSVPSSDTSSPRILKHTSRRIEGLPPTPPTHSRQSSGNQSGITSAPRIDVSSRRSPAHGRSTPSTPPNQRSPPTPDFTPPRQPPLAFRPPPSDRYPSSRTDSFKTARENLDSDEDEVSTVRPIMPSARPSEIEVPRVRNKEARHKEVGLGLGLESDNDGTTTPRQERDSQKEFVVFDGDWAASGGEEIEVEREWDDNLMRNVTVRKRPARKLHLITDDPTIEVIEDDLISPTSATRVLRGLPLQARIAKHRRDRETANRRSTEQFAERIAWPAVVADPESPSTPDVRRFSTMSGRSGTSAIVEAMVVDAPPIRRKTLRHTKKQLGLRDFSVEQSVASRQSSVTSNDHRQLHHVRGRIPESRHKSLASNGTISTNSTSKLRREILNNGGIPVVVIPDRRSSSKSSKPPSLRSTSSRQTKRSNSLTSAPLSHSSKFNEPGYFEGAIRKRAMSESGGSNHSVRTIDFPPSIPVRRSSLSAPTSRNGSRSGSVVSTSRNHSRTGSLTMESLKAHNMLGVKTQPAPEEEHTQPTKSQKDLTHRHTQLNVDHNGDPFFGNRLSTQVTPFSQYSYETAGTAAEVSEALAVSIFPHQNRSVLVVQHQPPEPSLTLETTDSSNKRHPTMTINGTATNGPVTPPQPSHPMDEVDSPLRNPRIPPQPPAIKFIPPTPAGLTPGHEEERQLGYDPNEQLTVEEPKRSMSLVRRAFSRRRNSEPAAPPGVGFLRRTFSLSNNPRREQADEATQTSKPDANPPTLYPSVSDKPADSSKLHPFWRPAHFWDDLEDNDDDYDDLVSGFSLVDNRPAAPKRGLSQKLKRTFAILPIKDDDYPFTQETARRTVRRTASGNMRVVKHRSNSSLRREQASQRRSYVEDQRPHSEGNTMKEPPFGYNFREGNGGRRGYSIPGLSLRVEYVGWAGLKKRVSERRREQRNQKLRASISGPRTVQSGVDDVLRKKDISG